MGKMIRKILVANRGEIAVRLMRTARDMGIRTVAVFSEEDRNSLHMKAADEAWCIGKVELQETYLNIPKIIETARSSGADAIHPGYGFLSENPAFVTACNDAGIIFIGPASGVMHTMGNKIEARDFAMKSGVPVVAGFSGKKEDILREAVNLRFPVLVKAAAGGGGKGMKVVHRQEDLKEALDSASRQAKAYFGDETVYIEKYIEDPRHIEIQILGDQHGNVIHLFERECSVQRRYQKIIEESPSPTLTPEVRRQMGAAAVMLGKAIGYTGAGTIEFLVDRELNFYFLEMNTRIQVEHPVTELVTGIDIVREQIHIAEGKPLTLRQEDLSQCGHAIECRIYAEDPENNFLPSPGNMTFFHAPAGHGIRVDSSATEATSISPAYDPMIAKLITYAPDRSDAIAEMSSALEDFIVHGIKTNTEFLSSIMRDAAYIENRISTGYCDARLADLIADIRKRKDDVPDLLPVAAFLLSEISPEAGNDNVWKMTGFWRNMIIYPVILENKKYNLEIRKSPSSITFELEGKPHEMSLISRRNNRFTFLLDGNSHTAWISSGNHGSQVTTSGLTFNLSTPVRLPSGQHAFSAGVENHSGEIHAPMPGKVIRINTREGETVEKGKVLLIMEAMKMENSVTAPVNGIIEKLYVQMNDRVESGTKLIDIKKQNKDE